MLASIDEPDRHERSDAGAPPRPAPASFDIFCRVIDNLGDIGVCYRLARQLVAEHAARVRLWLDAPEALARIEPAYTPAEPADCVRGVQVRYWPDAPFTEPLAEVLIEAFGSGLPDAVLEVLERASWQGSAPPPTWIVLEYLSAEAWVETCHRLPSPPVRGALPRYYYFPGWTDRTGGLLREADLFARRDVARMRGQVEFLEEFGLRPPEPGQLTVSLFCYQLPEGALAAWANGSERLRCLVPEGIARAALARHFGTDRLAVGHEVRWGALDIVTIPFLPQDDYDRLLWACDLNFVRGEDSLVRALWAERPFIWQIYPQADDAHGDKLRAFLARYGEGVDAAYAAILNECTLAWNGLGSTGDFAACWARLTACLPELAGAAARRTEALASQTDLATQLTRFCASLRAHQTDGT